MPCSGFLIWLFELADDVGDAIASALDELFYWWTR